MIHRALQKIAVRVFALVLLPVIAAPSQADWVSAGLQGEAVRAIVQCRSGVRFAAAGEGVRRSFDGGATWIRIADERFGDASGSDYKAALAVSPATGTLLVGTMAFTTPGIRRLRGHTDPVVRVFSLSWVHGERQAPSPMQSRVVTCPLVDAIL